MALTKCKGVRRGSGGNGGQVPALRNRISGHRTRHEVLYHDGGVVCCHGDERAERTLAWLGRCPSNDNEELLKR